MRTLLRKASRRISRSTGPWLTLVLLFVVLVPSVFLLWFMNQAMQNEQLAVRQKLVDAYRVQLTGIQEKLEVSWKKIDDDVEAQRNDLSASARFARLVRAGRADAVVIFNSDQSMAYPTLTEPARRMRSEPVWRTAEELESRDKLAAAAAYRRIAQETTDATVGARALQAEARNLFQAGAVGEALAVVNHSLQEARFAKTLDLQNRLIVPNTELLALEFLGSTRREEFQPILQRLRARVLDYENASLPSSQRRFIMHELQRLSPEPALLRLLAAEDLAAAYGETSPRRGDSSVAIVRRTTLSDVWEKYSRGDDSVLLYRAEGLSARLKEILSPLELPKDVRIQLLPPGEEKDAALLMLSAGPTMPGWRLALSSEDAQFAGGTGQGRSNSYRWIGLLMVFILATLALLVWGLVRRQIALTELRNDLVANVTHELKTPLASMRLLVETLLNAPTWNESTAREYLQLIATENLRLSRLIGNFLTFSRIERNKYTFHFEEVSARAITDAAVTALGDRFQSPNCHFEVTALTDLPRITADADAIVTALVNLLDNAWKYSGEAKRILLKAGVNGDDVYWSVTDNGIGLSPRDTKRIFHRFHQVNTLYSSAGGGCGLGLSIVQFIIEAHQGEVRVESLLEQGSTFTLALPLSRKSPSTKVVS